MLLNPPALQAWGAPGHLSPSWSGKAPSVGPQRLEEGAALVASAFQILRGFWRHSNETRLRCDHHLDRLHGEHCCQKYGKDRTRCLEHKSKETSTQRIVSCIRNTLEYFLQHRPGGCFALSVSGLKGPHQHHEPVVGLLLILNRKVSRGSRGTNWHSSPRKMINPSTASCCVTKKSRVALQDSMPEIS